MKKLLVVVGPTGTGKTGLAIGLAKKFDGEIVSADSRQVYVGMDVGTAKSSQIKKSKVKSQKIEKGRNFWVVDGVPVHLYDVITPDKSFSVVDYQQLAYEKINEIHSRNKLPILAGGTGLYVQAVVEGLKIPKTAPDKNLRAQLESQPLPILISKLKKVDPVIASKIDKQNPRRVVRALEIYYQTGEPPSKLSRKFRPEFDSLQIGLTAARDYLYQRTDKRIEGWFREGFIEEVKKLLADGYSVDLPAMTSLGYRQVAMYLAGKIPLEEARQRIKWEHHSYIRRQITWFRKSGGVIWFDIEEKNFKQKISKKVERWLA